MVYDFDLDGLLPAERRNYKRILGGTTEESVWMNSLYILSKLLALHHKKNLIVLIDEFVRQEVTLKKYLCSLILIGQGVSKPCCHPASARRVIFLCQAAGKA